MGALHLEVESKQLEVEEVSDLIISMHQGVHAKNQGILDRYYRDFDSEYEWSGEVERRFEIVMAAIDASIGKRLKEMEFSRQALFNSLFVAVYHLVFGLGERLVNGAKPKRLPAKFGAEIGRLSNEIISDEISDELRQSLRGATAHYGTRLERVNFILEAFGYAIEES
jgi:hypothetical protein